jgi:cytochrome P450
MDPSLYPSPSTFDGFRHSNLLESISHDPAAVGKTKWASANLESMAFGYGRHACPGRFFADYEIKLIMVHLLMTYDIERGVGQKGRPENFMAEAQMIPNHDAKVRMRRRRT